METKQEAEESTSAEGKSSEATSSNVEQYQHLNDELTQLEKALEVARKGNDDEETGPIPPEDEDEDKRGVKRKSPDALEVAKKENDDDEEETGPVSPEEEDKRGVKRKSSVEEDPEDNPDSSAALDNFLINTLAKRNVSIALVKPTEETDDAKRKGGHKTDSTDKKNKKATKKKANTKDKDSKDDKEGLSDDDESKKASRKKLFERKNIRDIVADDQLEPETLAAQKEEQERIRRLQDAQQRALLEKLNQAFNEASVGSAALPTFNEMSIKPIFPSTSSKPSDVIMVETSNEEERKKLFVQQQPTESAEKNRIISLSSSDDSSSSTDTTSEESEDDDCIMVLSDEGEGDNEVEENVNDDPNNSGSHTNDMFNQPDAEGRVLVNMGHPPEEQDVFLAPQLSRAVKPHQVGGIRFLYDNVVESIQRFPTSSGFGCILAHSMGLGKTIQVISFVDVFLRHTTARTALCVVPINTIQNWMTEFDMWLPGEGAVPQPLIDSNEIRPRNFRVFLLNENYKTTASRAKLVLEWHKVGGVLLLGYEMYRLLAMKKISKINMKRRKNKKKDDFSPLDTENEDEAIKLLDEIFLALVNPGPDLIICDEGHRIKNCSASTSTALKKILTKRRVVLTGYPLQNNLLEYWCMVDFVRPNYLGTRAEFCNMFERPIQNGQCIDSTMKDRQLMRYRAHVLHSLLEGFVQRRGHSVLRLSLPSKEEHVLLIRMTNIQRSLYREFTKDIRYRCGATNPLMFFAVCCKIWNHPDVLFNFIKFQKSQGVLDNDLDFDLAGHTTNSTCIDKINGVKDEKNDLCAFNNQDHSVTTVENKPPYIQDPGLLVENKPPYIQDPGLLVENKPPYIQDPGITPPTKERDNSINYEWAVPLLTNYQLGKLENSHKMTVLFTIIEQSLMVGDKILIFSQSLLTLDLIEKFLMERNVPSPSAITERWCKSRNYFRLDGKTSSQERERLIKEYNRNPSVYLFLLSTRAGCLGINLVAANRIVVYDASWNPCHDAQAVCRSYRYGQRKQCFIYRLVTDNCLEKKVYDRQVNKQGMSDRVVDELNPESNFTSKEVNTLIHESEDDGPIVEMKSSISKYKDHILQYICECMSQSVSKEPFEHESLLIDRKELRLTKQEKKLAKQSYEQEKRGNLGYQRHTQYGYYQKNPSGGSVFVRLPLPPGTKLPVVYATHGTSGARILPSQSTPIPMQPAGTLRAAVPGQAKQFIVQRNSSSLLIRTLLQQGVMVRRVIPPTDFTVSVISGNPTTITIPAGQEVLVLRTPKGVYLRLPDGRIVAVRLPADFMSQWQAPTPIPATPVAAANTNNPATGTGTVENSGTNGTPGATWNQQSFGFVHPNLHCGGSIKVVQGKVPTDSKVAQPEVIDLSDDESSMKDNPKEHQLAASQKTPITLSVPSGQVSIAPSPSVTVVTVPRQPLSATRRLIAAAPTRAIMSAPTRLIAAATTRPMSTIVRTVPPSRLTATALKLPSASLPKTLIPQSSPLPASMTSPPAQLAAKTLAQSAPLPMARSVTVSSAPLQQPPVIQQQQSSRSIPPVSVPMPATTMASSVPTRPTVPVSSAPMQPLQQDLSVTESSTHVQTPLPAHVPTSLPAHVPTSMPAHVPTPLPVHVSTPLPAHTVPQPEPESLSDRLSSDDSFPSSSSHSTENDQNSYMYNPSMDDHNCSQAMYPSPDAQNMGHNQPGMVQNEQNSAMSATDDYHGQMKDQQMDQMPSYYDLQPYHGYPYHDSTSGVPYGHSSGYHGYMPYNQQPYHYPSTSQDMGMMQNYDYDMQPNMGYQPYRSHMDQHLVTNKHNNLLSSNHLVDQQYMSQGYPMSQNYSFHHQNYLPPNMYNAP